MDAITIKAFQCISNLLTDLREVCKNDKPLALYDRLIEKTTIRNEEALLKHVNVFRDFIETYKDQILSNDDLEENVEIIYRKDEKIQIYIAIGKIMKTCEEEEKNIIKNHLLTICAVFFPESSAIELLEEKCKHISQDNDILSSLIGTVGEGLKECNSDDPAEIMSSFFQSDAAKKIMVQLKDGVENGQITMSTMTGMMSTMMGSLKQ